MKSVRKIMVIGVAGVALCAVGALLVTLPAQANTNAPGTLTFTPLTLINGWTNAPFATRNAAVAKDLNGIVHFKGAIATAGTNPEPFILRKSVRPTSNVYVAVDLCNATNGRLHIGTDGVVTVDAETDFAHAQCFTSLEGVSYAQ
jgi:hypothetical protein